MSFQPHFDFVEELRWRGLLHDAMPGTQEMLNTEQVTGYVGFDPTADSLHIGNLVPIMQLVHFQRAGHKPIALVGGATGMVGDPSGKSDERKLLDIATIDHNIACQKKQLQKFIDFGDTGNQAKMVNNYDWFKNWSFLDFIRDVGKHITVSYMMGKDSVRNRLEAGGISFTEFSYQLVQGYDFMHLYKHEGCKLQMGGSDQWGNITTGTELIRRMAGGEGFALTAPLITKSDGTKFGKSEGGNVWLDPTKTSPYKFYQFWLNVADEDAIRFIKIYSLKCKAEIEQLIANHTGQEHLRSLQKELAAEMTVRVHSEADLAMALKATQIFFGNGSADDLKALDEATLAAASEGMERFEVSREALQTGIHVMDLLATHTQIFPSKSEARKMLQANGFAFNKDKYTDVDGAINTDLLMHNRYLIAQKGKKQYFLIEAV
ncbi:MAG: tyrosine--tRNA ligase [Bacteroidetes bacterium]|jgi:tyrosyl-tRNA synthetase|nr:tyrosine--tRNA ligase [Bacteroidota bacterium]